MLALTVCLALAVAVPFIASIFVERHASNIPIFALLVWACVPGVSAAFFTCQQRVRDLDGSPFATFLGGLCRNTFGALTLAAPVIALGGFTAFNAAFGDAAGVPAGFMWAGIGITVVALVWLSHVLHIHAQFEFRLRDVARLGLYYVTATPRVSLGALSLWVFSLGVVYFTSDGVLVLSGGVVSYLFWRNALPLLNDVRARFVEAAPV
jgi:hypothetical protein